nr:helix-turn-helix transcriptional regulator [uncultured Schaedlerella sp.]
MDFYERLNSLIKSKGLSQRKVEIALGFSNGAISKWKKYSPNAEKVQLLAQYFDVSFDFLMNGKSEKENEYYYNKETADMAQQIFENKDLRVLFDAAKDASPEDLKTTHDMLMALKKKERGIIDD